MYSVTVSIRGQVVLPAEFRKKLQIKDGDELVASLEDNKITLSAKNKPPRAKGIVASTAGIWSDMKVSGKDFVEELRRASGRRLDTYESGN